MKLLTFKFILILIYLISSKVSYSIEQPNIGNLVIHKNSKTVENINFQSSNKEDLFLYDFKNSLVLINLWATWCVPCKKEMPSLDSLQNNKKFKTLKIIPINVSQESYQKMSKFYKDINFKNLDFYFDKKNLLPNIFKLRGVPTTILINKNGEEFARILGSTNFNEEEFINWLKIYD